VSEDTPPNPVSGNVLGNDTDVDTLDTHSVTQVNGLGANVGTPPPALRQCHHQFRRQLQLHAGQLQGLVQALAEGQSVTDPSPTPTPTIHGATSSTRSPHRPRHQ